MSLRILHVLDHSIPLHSGYTFRTLSILREQRRLGWETFHLTGAKQLGCDAAQESIDGWHFHRTPRRAGPPPRFPGVGEVRLMRDLERRLHEVALRVRPDILHAHSPVLDVLPALRVGARLGIPVAYEVRAFWEDAAVDHGTTTQGSLRYRLTHALETHALRRVGHVFTICEGLRQDILARGVAPEKVTVIPNAVDTEAFEAGGVGDAGLRTQLGLDSCKVIGFIGSFYAYEGLDLLLEALPRISVRAPNARLLLVGGGPQETALREQAGRLGLADRVVFTGRVPHDQVQRYYDLIDVLAYPRRSMRLTELVTPLKPLEAMAQGRLVVASDVGGHRELIRHGTTGLLFRAGSTESLADTLLGLLGDEAQGAALRAAGRRYAEEERNWARSVAGYRDAYRALVPGRFAAPASAGEAGGARSPA
jgi:PEP-CTERM/exosortase A-associated glycosyltransferase